MITLCTAHPIFLSPFEMVNLSFFNISRYQPFLSQTRFFSMTTKNPNAGLITNFFARVADKSNTEGKKHLKRTASTTETTEKEEEEELNKEQAPLKRYRIDTSQWTPEQRDLLALERRTMHPELTKPYFLSLKRFLQAEKLQKREIYPPEDQIYSWSNWTPFDQVKVVIIGQGKFIFM
jgi:hypothetical protein